MDRNENLLDSPEFLEDLGSRSEVDVYKTAEMILCDKCNRNNPPTRLDCIYCGKILTVSKTHSRLLRPILRKIERHENGSNLIYLANLDEWDEPCLAEAARMIRMEKSVLKDLVESRTPLPLARTNMTEELGIVSRRLSEMGIDTCILPDENFCLEKPSRRLRRIEFYDRKTILILFNGDEIVELNSNDIVLIVVGVSLEQKIESTEKYKKKADNKIINTSETTSDEVLVDVYTKTDGIGYRISTNGFDFSCLGEDKTMLASENISVLVEKLRSLNSTLKFDDNYNNLRSILSKVWELDERVDSLGMEKKGFGATTRKSQTTTNNLTQFARYSRLQWHLNHEGKRQKTKEQIETT